MGGNDDNNSGDSGDSSTIQNAILGGAISGGLGLLFFFLKLYISYLSNKRLKRALDGQDIQDKSLREFQRDCVKPVLMRFFDDLRTTQCLGYRNERLTLEYRRAMETLMARLSDDGVQVDFTKLVPSQQVLLLNTVSSALSLFLAKKQSRWASYYCRCRPEVMPHEIWTQMPHLLDHVMRELPRSLKGNSVDLSSKISSSFSVIV